MAAISPANFCALRNPIMADDFRFQSPQCCRLNRFEAFPAAQFQIKNDWRVLLSSKIQCFRDSAMVTEDSWENTVLNCETAVLVEFHASWCGPCRMVHRVIDEIALEYSGRLKCCMLDTDHDVHIADRYGIKVVPVVLLFKQGHKCETVVGTMPKEFYVAAIERVLSS